MSWEIVKIREGKDCEIELEDLRQEYEKRVKHLQDTREARDNQRAWDASINLMKVYVYRSKARLQETNSSFASLEDSSDWEYCVSIGERVLNVHAEEEVALSDLAAVYLLTECLLGAPKWEIPALDSFLETQRLP